ncbi:MAG TPA: glycosyl hydrolase 53 family protein [Chitinophagaceae bacterium]|nr:glycosyl hydrolase 53 family protein [Chitinophagaceae bacterium]
MKSILLIPLTIWLASFIPVKNKPDYAEPLKKFYKWDEFNMGVDLSYVNQIEDYGGVYRDSGQVRDCFRILKDHGANTVRVRLWHTPAWVGKLNAGKLYFDLYGVEKTIRRAKEVGLAVNLDIHYSDTWADPQKQETPAAWKDLPLEVLKDSVYNYTQAVLSYYKSKNLVPEMVQVGNENNNGMCWPVGKIVNNDFSSYAVLLKSGIKAVRDFSKTSSVKPKVIIHEAQLQTAGWWMNGITKNGVADYDIIGLSHYTKWSSVKTMRGVTDTIQKLVNTYKKTVMIVETGYPWTSENGDSYSNIFSARDTAPGYEISPDDQYRYLKHLTQAIINGGGKGVQYWEPAWITSKLNDGWGTGSSWDNVTLFDFNGNVLKGADYMCYPYKF